MWCNGAQSITFCALLDSFKTQQKKLHSGREWHEWQISALVERGRGQFLECVYTQQCGLSVNGGGGETNF